MWIGLTIWALSMVFLGLLVGWRLILRPSGWALWFALSRLAMIIVLRFPDPVFMGVLVGKVLIQLFKYRTDLTKRPYIRWREAQALKSPFGINEYRENY